MTSAEAVLSAATTSSGKLPNTTPLSLSCEDSRQGAATEALPAIWDNWDDFVTVSKKFTDDRRQLLTVVNGLKEGAQSVDDQSRAVRSAIFKAVKNRLL
jgi:cytochrome c556